MNPMLPKVPVPAPLSGTRPGRHRRPSPGREAGEIALRTTRGAGGEVVVEEIPLTLEILLHPDEDVQVPQGNPHYRQLYPLAQGLQRFLERRRRGWGVFSDVMVTWAQKRLPPVAPDVVIVDRIADPEAVGSSLDVAAEGCRVRAVLEVVTTSSKARRAKDEKHNRKLYAAAGVEDYVLTYPRQHRERGDPALRSFVLAGGVYRERSADAEGRFLLRSVGLRLAVGESGELVFTDVATGERVLSWDHEEALRRSAERRAEEEAEARRDAERRAATEATARQDAERQVAEMLVAVLESRGLAVDDTARERILGCRDGEMLRHWSRRALTATKIGELWEE